MGERVYERGAAAPRARRSQAARTASTRARILQAVLESIDQVGFARTTAHEIARRAGVTWGAVQHHFGGKEGVLEALLEASFAQFAQRLGGIAQETDRLGERVHLFIQRAWQHFASPEYRSVFEILLHHAGRGEGTAGADWQAAMFRSWDAIWLELFAAAPISRQRHRVLEHYTIATLSGLATTLLLEGGAAAVRGEELQLLEKFLMTELQRA